jgi:hypothetical protein
VGGVGWPGHGGLARRVDSGALEQSSVDGRRSTVDKAGQGRAGQGQGQEGAAGKGRARQGRRGRAMIKMTGARLGPQLSTTTKGEGRGARRGFESTGCRRLCCAERC